MEEFELEPYDLSFVNVCPYDHPLM